jgi:type II secretory pathway predicted ATPase ExeA
MTRDTRTAAEKAAEEAAAQRAAAGIVDAVYGKTGVPHYDGNPLIEALPPLCSDEQVLEVVGHFPVVSADEVALPAHVRRHCVGRVFSLVQPSALHLQAFHACDQLLRSGYVGRHPFSLESQRFQYAIGKERGVVSSVAHEKATSGVAMVQGLSGSGKSTMVKRILSYYPQVIQHTAFGERRFLQCQVVYLYVACPHDASLRQFAISFFEALDRALGTRHAASIRGSRLGPADLLAKLRQLCATYYVGLIVVDELQHLSLAKAGGEEKMLNFFVNLVNDVGVPLLLVGTYKASGLFEKTIQEARRACGDGMLDLRRPTKDDAWWHMLVETVWSLQWTDQLAPLTPDIETLLYDKSQGIPDVLVKLIVVGQRRAIAMGKPMVTAKDIRDASDNELALLKPALAALRRNRPNALQKYEDLLPPKDLVLGRIEAQERIMTLDPARVLELLQAVRPAPRASTPAAGDPAPALPSAEPPAAQDSAADADIRSKWAGNSLLESVTADDVVADLERRGLVVSALD